MSTVRLRGYDIDFPHPVPYDIQQAYMEKVLTCLDNKTHGVLESPTGTGKTLCLFAPVTAWTRLKKAQVVHTVPDLDRDLTSPYFDSKEQAGPWGTKSKSKVWYTARTHSQIAQTVSEVRKCNIEGLNIRVMGARDQLCINEIILEEKESYIKTIKCKELVKAKKCKHYNKLTYEKDFRRFFQSGDVLDIEDLVSLGKSCGLCPYYLSKKACESADIILLPYNYIIDKESRESNGFYLQDDVIIFDEGHNVPSTCEESYEFSFTSLDVALGIKNLQEVMLNLSKLTDDLIADEEIDVAKHASNSITMMEILQKLESSLSELNPSSELLPVSELYNFFSHAGITESKSRELVEGIAEFRNDSGKLSLSGGTLETLNLLEKMMNTIFGSSVRSFEKSVVDKSFKCSVTVDPDRRFVKKFSLFCFNPSFGIKSLLMLGAKSIIITSGTLSPLRTFISELGLPNPVTLENRHIADRSQVPFIILGTGVNNVRMDGAYKNRNDPQYVKSLGMSLTNLIASVPDGVLLLFSSYTMMQNLKEAWEGDLGIWTRLNSLKRVFVEPRSKNDFISCMENYKRAIDAGNGAILMGVLRGKISEGMDFKDQYCRGVFIIGVPFPPIQDPRVVGKQKYAESLMIFNPITKTEEKLYNESFVSIEAMKATNQAIGRVIRHGKDYGVIVLVDYRFAWPRLFLNVSSWLRGDTPVESNFPAAKKMVTDFFRNIHQGKLRVPEVHSQPVDANGCPIAGYVSYEEYDHSKQMRQARPTRLGRGSPPEIQTQPLSERKTRTDRGHSEIEYVDDHFNPQKILSLYKKSSWKYEETETKPPQQFNSLLEAIEHSNSKNCAKNFKDPNKIEGQETITEGAKRKFEDDDDDKEDKSKNVHPKLSPSLFSSPESSQGSQPKKGIRLKVRPLLPPTNENFDVLPEGKKDGAACKNDNISEAELKTKLIDYYKLVKNSLTKEREKKFKLASCKYMKGESSLADVVKIMDEVFLSQGKKNLFSDFSICIKQRDKLDWLNVCKKRGLLA